MRNGPGRLLRRWALLPAVAMAVTGVLAFTGAALAPPARSESAIDNVAKHLRRGPVYVDPRVSDQLTPNQAKSLSDQIKSADKPVFVAVLPANSEFPSQTVLRDVRSATGVTGVYAIHLGTLFDAGADPQVMSRNAVTNLVGQVQRSSGGNTAAEVDSFVDGALPQAAGLGPTSWQSRSNGVGPVGVIVVAAIVVVVVGGGYLLLRRRRKARQNKQRDQLRWVRKVVDEDITAFGEELDRLDFHPADPASDDLMRADYAQALDAYERAKLLMRAAHRPVDVESVTKAVEEGRFALATLDARRSGKPLPERRPPCFFDPRHGPSVRDVSWAPPAAARATSPPARRTWPASPTATPDDPQRRHRPRPAAVLERRLGLRSLRRRLLRQRPAPRPAGRHPARRLPLRPRLRLRRRIRPRRRLGRPRGRRLLGLRLQPGRLRRRGWRWRRRGRFRRRRR